MNAQEYISSGAIEACLWGLASEEDWLELEQMVASYAEVKAVKESLEKELENQHLAHAATPPDALKNTIMKSLNFETVIEKIETPVIQLQKEEEKPAKPSVVPLVPTPKPVKWLQRAVAVCIILLMGSILLNFYFFSQSAAAKKKYAALVLEQNTLLTKNQAMEASFRTIKAPEMKLVKMGPTAAQPGSMATIYWDTSTKDVYLLVNNLPKHSENKQYQLWAIVDGKPVDAGMVDDNGENILLKMHNIPNAQAFAITLEKKGGNPTPTMDAMYVIGEV